MIKIYFIENQLGRPILMSERLDDGDGSYFTENASGYPFWEAIYLPFGQVNDDFDSSGITIGDIETTVVQRIFRSLVSFAETFPIKFTLPVTPFA